MVLCVCSILWTTLPTNVAASTSENKASVRFYPSNDTIDSQQEDATDPTTGLAFVGRPLNKTVGNED